MGEEEGLEITFYPPLYIQRYEKVLEFLLEERWVHAISRVVIQSYFYWRYGRICLCRMAVQPPNPTTVVLLHSIVKILGHII